MKCIKSIDLKQLIRIIKEKKVACFGTGIQGKRVADFFLNWGVADQLIAYIDNNENRVGKVMQCGGHSYPIYSLGDAIQKLPSNLLILITCLDFKSIYKQLERVSENNWMCIAIDEVAEVELEKSDYPEVVRETETPIIPKLIHYVWLGENMPNTIKQNVAHWKELCPDYEFCEWNDKNYDISSNQYMRQAYYLKKWGFVSDYMRLDLVYRYGGIYLDTDIEMIKKPDELLYQRCFGCVDSSLTMNTGSGFGAAPKTEIIRELRDYYDTIFLVDDGKFDNVSCNSHSYHVLNRYGVKINNQLQNVHGMNIYPMIFQGACQYTKKRKITDKTFWIHYGNMSWFKNTYI